MGHTPILETDFGFITKNPPDSSVGSVNTGYELTLADAQVSLLGEREYLRIVMANGELPDLQYVLQKDKQTIQTFSAANGQYMAYGPAKLADGAYQLEIASSLFPANSVRYGITLSGSAGERRVEWRK